jgi:aliphatic nitrilase
MADAYPTVKVAAVHAASVFLDRDACVEKACALIEEAGREGAGLIAFPETFLPGYPFWIWTHTTRHSAPLFAELYANAVELPSEASRAIGDAARRAGAWVVMGLNEREGGTLYNTLAYFDDQGRLVARHRKLQPTHVERTIWGRGDGRDVFVLDTPLGRLGGLICFEHTMDLNRYSLTALGQQIHIAAWPAISALAHDPNSANFDNYTETAIKYHAMAAQTYVVCVQSRIDKATLEYLGFADQPDMMREGGGFSAIVGPDANYVAGPHRDDEGILYGDIDIGNIRFGKFFCDSAGHYARPDVSSFGIDGRPQTPLTTPPVRAIAMEALLEEALEAEAVEDATVVPRLLTAPSPPRP